nr:iron chelate uptake ABC transporter family permease subunit [Planococcus glaciei]
MALSVIHLTQGQADYTISELLTGVWTDGRIQDIVTSLRLPRLAIGIVAGGALAVSGAVLQTLTNNPLASPGTLGINAGAFFFVVLSMIFLSECIGGFSFHHSAAWSRPFFGLGSRLGWQSDGAGTSGFDRNDYFPFIFFFDRCHAIAFLKMKRTACSCGDPARSSN